MAENNWAIVVGINQYEHLPPDDHLKYAVKDAVKVRQFLCEQAQFPQENVLLCCDIAPGVSPMQRPSRSGLRDLLRNKIKTAKGANNFWFFYAGHGIVHDHQDFLLPCDGNPHDLRETAIPISFVTDCLRDCGAHNVVLVLDMCRNRTRSAEEGSRGMGEVMGEQTREIAKEQGIVTLFSCSRGQRSYEIKELEQGAFTYALLEGLRQSTTPRALEQYLTTRLPELNRQYGKDRQVPMVIPEPGAKYDLPLLLSCATPADIQQLAVQAMNAELEEDYGRAEGLWWQVIEAAQSAPSDRTGARRAIARIGGKKQQPNREAEERRKAEEQEKQRLAQEKAEQQAERERQQQAQAQKQAEAQRKQQEQAGAERKRRQAEAQRKREEAERQKQAAAIDQDDLSSERWGANYYAKLRDLLAAKDWKAADQETAQRMCDVMVRQKEGWLRVEDIKNFPCQDLRNIDRLWVKYSNGKFGFSVQREIWQSCGSPTDYNKNWEKFGVVVGWRNKGVFGMGADWLSYSLFTFDLIAPKGHLPAMRWRGVWNEGVAVMLRGWGVGMAARGIDVCGGVFGWRRLLSRQDL